MTSFEQFVTEQTKNCIDQVDTNQKYKLLQQFEQLSVLQQQQYQQKVKLSINSTETLQQPLQVKENNDAIRPDNLSDKQILKIATAVMSLKANNIKNQAYIKMKKITPSDIQKAVQLFDEGDLMINQQLIDQNCLAEKIIQQYQTYSKNE